MIVAAPHVHSNPQQLIKNPLSTKAENENKIKADTTHLADKIKKEEVIDSHHLFPCATEENPLFFGNNNKNACSINVFRKQ